MTYFDQSQLSTDADFRNRIAAAVATQLESLGLERPTQWADQHQWQIAGAPGFAAAYASAIAGDVENPGRDPSVITDADLLAAVQAELARWKALIEEQDTP